MITLFSILCSFWYITIAKELLIAMPGVKPDMEDQYLCHGLNLNNETYFITGFKPKADAQHAHHILIYGCTEPGSFKDVWNCQEMSNKINQREVKPACKEGDSLIYSWAMNAPGMKLPKDVSFMVGKNTDKPYLVIQAHYKNVDAFKNPGGKTDKSGINLEIQENPTGKLAGLYIILTDGSIPGHSTVFMEAACSFNGNSAIHPFAFRTHTHKLGQLVSGYVIHNNKWIEIGKKSPQEEQMFYPVEKDISIIPGDTLAARCVMKNDGDKLIKIGSTKEDEMCNFYFMYWVNKADISQLSDKYNQMCSSLGWPDFKWSQMLDPNGIPDSASILPGSNKVFKEIENNFKQAEDDMEKTFKQAAKGMKTEFESMFGQDSLQNQERRSNNFQDAMNYNMDDFNNENEYF